MVFPGDNEFIAIGFCFKNPEAINKTAPEIINLTWVNHIGVNLGLISNNPLANNPDTPHITAAIAARNVHNLRVFAGTISFTFFFLIHLIIKPQK